MSSGQPFLLSLPFSRPPPTPFFRPSVQCTPAIIKHQSHNLHIMPEIIYKHLHYRNLSKTWMLQGGEIEPVSVNDIKRFKILYHAKQTAFSFVLLQSGIYMLHLNEFKMTEEINNWGRFWAGLRIKIFTRTNIFLRWTYFGTTRFIHRWTTLVHATLRIRDVTAKWNRWLADITFDWRHVMTTAVKRNNQLRRFITILRRLFYKIYTKISQIMTKKNDVETQYKYKRLISIFCCSSKYERNGSCTKLPCHLLDSLRTYFDE